MEPSSTTALRPSEAMRLEALEQRIAAGLDTFQLVGSSLLVIRDDRLYRATHATFEAYLEERWGISRRRGYQLIEAARVVQNVNHGTQADSGDLSGVCTIVHTSDSGHDALSTIVDIDPPANEAQARPLTRLPADEQAQAWREAVSTAPDGRVTAAHVAEVVARRVDEVPHHEPSQPAASAAAGGDEPGTVDPQPAPTPAHPTRRTADRQDWATPRALFDLLDEEFGFTLDACATPENALCQRYYTEEVDGLQQSWASEVVFCNPPYGDKHAWVLKGYVEASESDATVVLLIPATTDTALWWDYCRHGEVRFLRGRLRFDDGVTAAPFPSALVIFRPGVRSIDRAVVWWDEWGPEGTADA